MVPIVMGARPRDYETIAPRHSYIHTDDFASPKDLAQFLHKLDLNDKLYNSYFRWKGTGGYISRNHYHWCNLCAKLHKLPEPKVYNNLTEWLTREACIGPGKWPENA